MRRGGGATQASAAEAEGAMAEAGRPKRLRPQHRRSSHPWMAGAGARCAVWRRRLTVARTWQPWLRTKCCGKAPSASEDAEAGVRRPRAPCLVDAEARCVKGRRCTRCTPEGGRQLSAKVSGGGRPHGLWGRRPPWPVRGREDSSHKLRAAKQLRQQRRAAGGERWGGQTAARAHVCSPVRRASTSSEASPTSCENAARRPCARGCARGFKARPRHPMLVAGHTETTEGGHTETSCNCGRPYRNHCGRPYRNHVWDA